MSAAVESLAGTLVLRPGARDAIRIARPDVARLAVGRPASELPLLLPLVFTLCAHAHRFTAQRALQAARARTDDAVSAHDAQALRAACARDQLLRIAHDWPRLLGDTDERRAPLPLADCPLWRGDGASSAAWPALAAWLEQHWLGCTPQAWLGRWDAQGAGFGAHWCGATDTALAQLLHRVRASAEAALAAGPAWCQRGVVEPVMAALAAQLAARNEFEREAVVPDTGPWTRRHDATGHAADNAWMRLLSRIADLLRLVEPGGAGWLAHGALACGEGEGIAWTEMARGLLVHWVRIEPSPQGPRTADCRVLAPTDLNFHPRGVLARALREQHGATAARVLAAAFDPCLAFRVESHAAAEEARACTN